MRLGTLSLGICLAVGCAGQNSQLATCQAEKEQLLTTIRSQRDTSRTLNGQLASVENRLDQAEKELALAGGGTRLSSRPSETLPASKAQSLPWRAPAGEPKVSAEEVRRTRAGPAPGDSTRLDPARPDRRVKSDATAKGETQRR